MARTAVVIPALNEAARIVPVIADVREALPAANVVVIDDGSQDETRAVALAAGARVVSHPFNLGYGAALQTGYLYAIREGYDRVVQLDADGQHDPRVAPLLIAALNAGANVALGSRRLAGGAPMPAVRRFGSSVLRWIGRTFGGVRVSDPTSGFRALDETALRLLASELPADYPDIDVLIRLRFAGLKLIEVPAAVRPRGGGVSMHRGLKPLYYAYKVALASLMAAVRGRRTPGRRT